MIKLIAALSGVALLSGCATVFTASEKQVEFTSSSPESIRVMQKDDDDIYHTVYEGTTPVKLTLSQRDYRYYVAAKNEDGNYVNPQMVDEHGLSNWILADIPLILVAFPIDVINGAGLVLPDSFAVANPNHLYLPDFMPPQ